MGQDVNLASQNSNFFQTFFKKLEYRVLVESTKVESVSFPYKTAISEANVKKNRMVKHGRRKEFEGGAGGGGDRRSVILVTHFSA